MPSAIFTPCQDVRFEWQTSFPNKLAFAANGWQVLAHALAQLEVLHLASELRVEQGIIGDLAMPVLPLTIQLNQFPLVFSASSSRPSNGLSPNG